MWRILFLRCAKRALAPEPDESPRPVDLVNWRPMISPSFRIPSFDALLGNPRDRQPEETLSLRLCEKVGSRGEDDTFLRALGQQSFRGESLRQGNPEA